MASDYEFQKLVSEVRKYKNFGLLAMTSMVMSIFVMIFAFLTGQNNNLALGLISGLLFFGVGGAWAISGRKLKGKPRLADAAIEANAVSFIRSLAPELYRQNEVYDRAQVEIVSQLNSQVSTKPNRSSCPFCAEDISANARICRHCGSDLEKAAS